jgi:hypothetical protein
MQPRLHRPAQRRKLVETSRMEPQWLGLRQVQHHRLGRAEAHSDDESHQQGNENCVTAQRFPCRSHASRCPYALVPAAVPARVV